MSATTTAESASGPDGSNEFSFLRATHSFDAQTLAMTQATSSDILSFEEGDLVILHAIHASGWGDASVLFSGKRGWIPTNYFTAYAEFSMIPLLSAVLSLAQCSSMAISEDRKRNAAEGQQYSHQTVGSVGGSGGEAAFSQTPTTITSNTDNDTGMSPPDGMGKKGLRSPKLTLFASIKNGLGFSRPMSKKEKERIREKAQTPPIKAKDQLSRVQSQELTLVDSPSSIDSVPASVISDSGVPPEVVRSANVRAYHCVTSIVSGVRSLLENCGALTRDAYIVKSFQTIRRLRKTLLTELAILVSLAKHCKEAKRDDVLGMIDNMVLVAYKIVTKAAHFLDIRAELETDTPSRTATSKSTLSLRSACHRKGASDRTGFGSTGSASGAASGYLDMSDQSSINMTPKEVTPRTSQSPDIDPVNGTGANFAPQKLSLPFEDKQRFAAYSRSLPGSRRNSATSPGSNTAMPSPMSVVETQRSYPMPSVELLAIEGTSETGPISMALEKRLGHTNPDNENQSDKEGAVGKLLPAADPTSKVSTSEVTRTISVVTQSSEPNDSVAPLAAERLSEVYDALNYTLSIFMHRQAQLLSASEILVKTRRCMVACRELLVVADLINTRQLSKSKELDKYKDKMFAQIKDFVVRARAAASKSAESYTLASMSDMATDCAETSSMCVVMCRNILNKLGDFELPSTRTWVEFPEARSLLHQIPSSTSATAISISDPVSDKEDAEQSVSSTPDGPHQEIYRQGLFVSPSSPQLSRTQSTKTWSNANVTLPPDDPEQWVLRDSNGKLRGASFEALVALLTAENVSEKRAAVVNTGSSNGDQSLMSVFFLTFRLFCTPEELYRLLVKRFAPQVLESQLSFADMEMLAMRRVEVYQFIKLWMESHWLQSVDGVVLNPLLQFSEKHFDVHIPNGHSVLQGIAERLREMPDGQPVVPRPIIIEDVAWPTRCPAPSKHEGSSVETGDHFKQHYYSNLQAQIRGMASFPRLGRISADKINDGDAESAATTPLQKVGSESKSTSSVESGKLPIRNDHAKTMWKMRQSIFSSIGSMTVGGDKEGLLATHDITAFDAKDVASQLTVVDSLTFCSIEATEFMDQNFARKKRHLNLAPHIVEMTNLSNQLSTFVSESILEPDVTLKVRLKVLKQWIRIAEQALELGNFNCVLSIVSALQSVKILRLRNLWEMLPPKNNEKYQSLKRLLVPEKNFNAYRTALKAQPVPNIPYLGLVLSDFIFIEEGNPKYRLVDGHQLINIDRYEQLTRRIAEVQACQVAYDLQVNRDLQQWLLTKMSKAQEENDKDQNSLWRRSIVVQPK